MPSTQESQAVKEFFEQAAAAVQKAQLVATGWHSADGYFRRGEPTPQETLEYIEQYSSEFEDAYRAMNEAARQLPAAYREHILSCLNVINAFIARAIADTAATDVNQIVAAVMRDTRESLYYTAQKKEQIVPDEACLSAFQEHAAQLLAWEAPYQQSNAMVSHHRQTLGQVLEAFAAAYDTRAAYTNPIYDESAPLYAEPIYNDESDLLYNELPVSQMQNSTPSEPAPSPTDLSQKAPEPSTSTQLKTKPLIQELDALTKEIYNIVSEKEKKNFSMKLFSKRVASKSFESEEKKLLRWLANGMKALHNLPYTVIDSKEAEEKQRAVLAGMREKIETYKQAVSDRNQSSDAMLTEKLEQFYTKFKAATDSIIEECKQIIAPANTEIEIVPDNNASLVARKPNPIYESQSQATVFDDSGIQKTDSRSFVCKVTAEPMATAKAAAQSIAYQTTIQDKKATATITNDEARKLRGVTLDELQDAIQNKKNARESAKLLLKTVISQVDMCRQVDPDKPLVINQAFSAAYVKAVMLYARAQKYKIENQTGYPPKKISDIPEKEVKPFRKYLNNQEGAHNMNIQRHFESRFFKKQSGATEQKRAISHAEQTPRQRNEG